MISFDCDRSSEKSAPSADRHSTLPHVHSENARVHVSGCNVCLPLQQIKTVPRNDPRLETELIFSPHTRTHPEIGRCTWYDD